MTEQRTTPGERAELRRRYAFDAIPECPVCGAGLVTDHPRPFVDVVGQRVYLRTYCPNAESWTGRAADMEHARLATFHVAVGDAGVLAAVDDADALAGVRAEVGRLRAKAETVIDVLDTMKSLAAHAEEMTPMLTEAAIWWGDMVALVEKALGCAERMTAPGTGGDDGRA